MRPYHDVKSTRWDGEMSHDIRLVSQEPLMNPLITSPHGGSSTGGNGGGACPLDTSIKS